MKRTVFAKISVNDEVNNGQVIDTLEKQVLEMAHCDLEEAVCAEVDSDSRHERYINYLMNWAIEHNDEAYEGCSPASFDEFEDNEDYDAECDLACFIKGIKEDQGEEEVEYDLTLGINEGEFELDKRTGNITVNRKAIHYKTNFKVEQTIWIWFVDEDNAMAHYKVIGTTDEKLTCEFIG